MNRSERRAALYAKKREVCLAMGAAADVEHFEIAAEIARDANLDICPVCVSAACNYAQRVTWKGTSFWICEMCAKKHTATRDNMAPVPLYLGRLQRDVTKRLAFSVLYGGRVPTGSLASNYEQRLLDKLHIKIDEIIDAKGGK